MSRQSASAWLSGLKQEGVIDSTGVGRGVRYHLVALAHVHHVYPRAGLREDEVWREAIAPVLHDLLPNVRDIWHYALTEMVSNAIDHSVSEQVRVELHRDALNTTVYVAGEGEGIFLKIQRALELYDPREAILELAKGKPTTDPAHHAGEGIFFSSKVMDAFDIISGTLHFMHDEWGADMLLERPANAPGTVVLMRLSNDSARTLKDVFHEFAQNRAKMRNTYVAMIAHCCAIQVCGAEGGRCLSLLPSRESHRDLAERQASSSVGWR